jgi:hypothetical protein
LVSVISVTVHLIRFRAVSVTVHLVVSVTVHLINDPARPIVTVSVTVHLINDPARPIVAVLCHIMGQAGNDEAAMADVRRRMPANQISALSP